MNYYSIPEMASMLDVCRETVMKYLKQNDFLGVPGKDRLGRNITVYSEQAYNVVKTIIEGNKEVEKGYLTTNQVADLAECSPACVCITAKKYNIFKVVKPSDTTKKAYFPKESAEKVIEIITTNRERRLQKSKETAEKKEAENSASAELHPLVTDKRCLRLSWWPDIMPKCFEDLDKKTINF